MQIVVTFPDKTTQSFTQYNDYAITQNGELKLLETDVTLTGPSDIYTRVCFAAGGWSSFTVS